MATKDRALIARPVGNILREKSGYIQSDACFENLQSSLVFMLVFVFQMGNENVHVIHTVSFMKAPIMDTIGNVTFQVLTAVTSKSFVFWDMTPCKLTHSY
jgi:hypothetical protein